MNESVTICKVEDKTVYLVGCAHVSKKSVEDVKETIEKIQPDTVCVELCPARFEAMADQSRWKKMDIFQVIKKGKVTLVLAQLLMSSFYQKLGDKMGVQPGQEMLEGIEQAQKIGAKLVLADRPVEITLKRVWRHLFFWSKMKMALQLLGSLFDSEEISEEMIEEMKESQTLENALETLANTFPQLKKRLIDERDSYLAEKIRTAPGKTIVAVVGAGHVPGIQEKIHQEQDIESLEIVPPPSTTARILPWLIPLLIIGFVGFGFFRGSHTQSMQSIQIWLGSHALLAGLGTAIALGHPLTILSSIFAAPLTSLNPMIAAGWVAGLVQAWVKKPTVGDLERIPQEIKTVKGFWRNPMTRILLVVVLANIGSSLGTLISGTWILSHIP